LLFYAWGEKAGVLLIVALDRAQLPARPLGRPWRPAGPGRRHIALNVATLLVFKYANFAVGNVNAVLVALAVPTIGLKPVHLPIGVSFFTFEAIAYLVDIRRGDTRAQSACPERVRQQLFSPADDEPAGRPRQSFAIRCAPAMPKARSR